MNRGSTGTLFPGQKCIQLTPFAPKFKAVSHHRNSLFPSLSVPVKKFGFCAVFLLICSIVHMYTGHERKTQKP